MFHVALGIHPQNVPELSVAERTIDAETLARAIADSNAVAVGECGLDGATESRELQQSLFRMQIHAARLAKRPLVVHVFRAHDLAPKILREERAVEVGGVLHSYSGGAGLVPVYRDLNFAFSFAGPVTYPNAKKPLAAARAIPASLLLAETDAPDQAPVAHRGTRSEPAYLPEIIAGLAAARDADPAAIAALITANARRILGMANFG